MASEPKLIKVCLTNKGEDTETPWAHDLGPAQGAPTGSRKVKLVNVPFMHAKPTWGDTIVVSPVGDGFPTWDRNQIPWKQIATRIVEDGGRWAMIVDYVPNEGVADTDAFQALAKACDVEHLVCEGAWGPREAEPGRAYLAVMKDSTAESVIVKLRAAKLPMQLIQIHPEPKRDRPQTQVGLTALQPRKPGDAKSVAPASAQTTPGATPEPRRTPAAARVSTSAEPPPSKVALSTSPPAMPPPLKPAKGTSAKGGPAAQTAVAKAAPAKGTPAAPTALAKQAPAKGAPAALTAPAKQAHAKGAPPALTAPGKQAPAKGTPSALTAPAKQAPAKGASSAPSAPPKTAPAKVASAAATAPARTKPAKTSAAKSAPAKAVAKPPVKATPAKPSKAAAKLDGKGAKSAANKPAPNKPAAKSKRK